MPLGFQVKLGLVLPAGLHAAEAFHVSSFWSSMMPLASTRAILNLLDGPVSTDPAFHIFCAWFHMMRRYLTQCLEEEPRIIRMLDLISRSAQGHGPVHLLLISTAGVGLCGMGKREAGFGFLSLLSGW